MENNINAEVYALELKEITKKFGKVIANNNVSLDLKKGEILALLGENGSGKTTLMNMISGIYYPDKGKIFVNGERVEIKSPKDAIDLKIGMVHQHFKLVDVFTAKENITLGDKNPKADKNDIKKTIKDRFKHRYVSLDKFDGITELANKYGFNIDFNKKIYEMSVSEKQNVEIFKTIYHGANILILDEPTAVLTPQEIEKLFNILRNMREDGKSIIIITHKLNEVMAISDRVAILRKGEYVTTVNTSETNEKELADLMVGEKINLNIQRDVPKDTKDRLEIKGLTVKNREGINVVNNVSFTAYSGEILGIAGIAGSGQKELLEAVAGLQKINSGNIIYYDPAKNDEPVDLRSKTPVEIREMGVRLSFVPEDRLGMGLVGNMDLVDNVMLRSYRLGKGAFLDRKAPGKLTNEIVEGLQVVTPGVHTQVRKLSGGNVQKILVGREIAAAPKVLMTAYPVRGLDINSSYTIYNLLNEQKDKGVAVIYVGEDLDVILQLCDRVLVLCAGQVSGIVDARNITKEEVGLLMTKIGGENKNVEKMEVENAKE
jgi:general nucleoside transport system ATP-binding protein